MPELLEEAITVEAASWMKAAGVAMVDSRWRSEFYKRFAKYAAGEGILRLCFLRMEGKPIAMEYGIECRGRFFAHKIAYDGISSTARRGAYFEILRYAAERGLHSYEFQGKDAPWTYFWTQTVRPMVSVHASLTDPRIPALAAHSEALEQQFTLLSSLNIFVVISGLS